jgi:DNA repair protein RecO (recombination protein O)|tara:strand:+ start:361 stop:1041 length:681 start_codon:yes stop_codon:yes gene_type:complete
MIWQDEGYLLSKRKFRENANIVNVFTNSFGKVSGIVYGGNSRKVRNYLQISNKIFVFYNNKNENKIGYFKTELMQAISPKYFNDKTKTSALLSLTSLLNSLLPEAQSYKNIYLSLDNFINELNNEKWIFSYIDWELKLIRELGFDVNLSQFKNNASEPNKISEIEIDNIKYKVPGFIFKLSTNYDVNNDLIKLALSFTRKIMLNKFFIQNNLIFPRSRVLLENYYN